MTRRILVFTDDPGWHGKSLCAAFAMRDSEAVFVSLRDCRLDLSDSPPRIVIPGFDRIPTGAFVRGVPGGTLQQVIQRLNILHMLKALGCRVYNDGRAIERTVDKAMTSFLLRACGVPTPPTWVCESRAQALHILAQETMAGRALVLKPLFGSQGVGVRLLQAGSSLPVPMEQNVDGVYYLQAYVDSGDGAWHDFRVFVVRGRVVGAMRRVGCHWINNVAQGGRCEPLAAEGEIAELALAAAQAVDIDYCGVDIIRDRQGRLFVLEINSIPAWKGLQQVVNADVAQTLVDDFLSRLQPEAAS